MPAKRLIAKPRSTGAEKPTKWTEAALRAALKRDPTDHWALCQLSQACGEHGNASESLRVARRAEALDSTCPLVQWQLVLALLACKRFPDAVRLLKRCVRIGVNGFLKDPCGEAEGDEWVRKLVNHCRLLLAEQYLAQGHKRRARYYAQEFLESAAQGSTDSKLFERAVAVQIQAGRRYGLVARGAGEEPLVILL